MTARERRTTGKRGGEPVGIGQLLLEHCEREGMTYQQCSLDMGEPPNTVSRWISGDDVPGPKKYDLLAEYLGLDDDGVILAVGIDLLARARRQAIRAR
jgi:transcriptional regulator with XRE-family HTH domain